MSTKVAVVIPVYKEELNEFEKISLAQARKILGKYPFVFVAPEGKSFSYFEPGDAVIQFSQKFFQNIKTYSILLMSPFFYEPFLSLDYILIYQLDAFVFYDALENFCSLGYDYIGAPIAYHSWYVAKAKKIPRVGNGGFSLRKVKTCYQLLKGCAALSNWNDFLKNLDEDRFFGWCGVNDDINFHTAPIDVAAKFSVDYFPNHFLRLVGNKIPFGCHGWSRYSADAYFELFRKAGYDLRPFRSKMKSMDQMYLQNFLLFFAIRRLVRRMNHRQPLMRYLPKNHFASVRVVRSQLAMIIFAQLFTENPALADEVHLYDESDQDILIDDLNLKKEPHLLIAFGNVENFLLSAAESKGISYGRRIVSFEREYFSHCEKIFRALGK